MSSIEKEEKQSPSPSLPIDDDVPIEGETLVNVSGHVQEVDRNFGFWSICAIGVVADNAWGAGGGALVTALYNGGSPGVLYGLIAATFFYVFIGASLAELASAIPSSANVYHWASVTAGPKYGMYSFRPVLRQRLSKIRTCVQLLRWVVELPCLDIWHSFLFFVRSQ